MGSHGGDAGGDGIRLAGFQPQVKHPFLGRTVALEGATSDATVHLIEEEKRSASSAARSTRREAASNRTARRSTPLAPALLERERPEKAEIAQFLGPCSRASSVGRRANSPISLRCSLLASLYWLQSQVRCGGGIADFLNPRVPFGLRVKRDRRAA